MVSILRDERLFSRNLALKHGKMVNDNASKTVIDQTNSEYQNYTRLYFRPKSPTQFHNEGFKTKEQLKMSTLDAQCPVPVFLFFDIRKVLNREDCYFTERSLASSDDVPLYNTAAEFSELPFHKIYHDNRLSPEDKREIVGHRHAEIIVKDSLPIADYLSRIVVRTPAEKETLLALMDEKMIEKYSDLIIIDSTNIIFFKRWAHYHRVSLKNDSIELDLRLSEDTSLSKVKFDITYEQEVDGEVLEYTIKDWEPVTKKRLKFKNSRDAYGFRICFDGHLMYKGYFQKEENVPF